MGKDGIEIATAIKHFSHKHELKLSDDEFLNIEKCDGCIQVIPPPPPSSCVSCSFFLHESCAKLHAQKRHPLTLFPKSPYLSGRTFWYYACERYCNGFKYSCELCKFSLDVLCSSISDILAHHGHEHQLFLSSIIFEQKCSSYDFESYLIFREFAIDFKCATLPQIKRYKQHKHSFTLCYIAEDDFEEYYYGICEEKRDSKHWFYYCANCNYPTHTKCILSKNPNLK